MRKIAILSILVFMLAFAALNVSALQGAGSITLGDDSAAASYPDADNDEAHDAMETTTLAITNNEAGQLSNFQITFAPKNGFTTADLNLSASFQQATLDPTQSMTLTINGRIPEDLDAVDSDLEENSQAVADFTITSSGGSVTGEVLMQRENQLVFSSIDVCINEDDNCEDATKDGDSVDGIKPGDEVILKIEVENKYNNGKSEDVNFDDIELTWEIDEDDLSEDDDESFSLDAEETDEAVFRFSIDDDVSDGRYELVIRAEGDDDYGALHGEEVTVRLEIEKQSHDIEIRSYSADPTTLSCEDLTTRVNARFTNIGQRDENDVAFEVVNNELGIKERTDGIELDEGRSTDVGATIKLDDDARPGRYRLSLRSFYAGTAQSDEESIEIVVPDCTNQPAKEENTQTNTQEAQLAEQLRQLQEQQARARQRVTTTPTSTTQETGAGLDDGWLVALMGIGALAMLVVLVFLVVKIFRR